MNDFNNVVFKLTCNDSRKITDAILSKCSTIYIPPIKIDKIIIKFEEICNNEEIYYIIQMKLSILLLKAVMVIFLLQ
jgi:DNA polymerase III delta prime subunit